MEEFDDVDYRPTQSGSHQDECHQGRRHRLPRGSGRDPFGTDQQPHRAFQDPREGQPLASWSLETRFNAPLTPRLPKEDRRAAVQGPDRAAQDPPLIFYARARRVLAQFSDAVASVFASTGNTAVGRRRARSPSWE